ncbi:DUF1559 domain-containing protein [Rhodopirellula bahusiensis]|uniref:DUF1559 domain-containing protein n=1 Tax=Rhodopirellula bahusiensis TaxID=2014065 RepID=UPI00326597D2
MNLTFRPIEVFTIACGSLLSLAVLIPCVQAAREDARGTRCQQNLVELGLAFQKYESVHRGFPPRRTGFNNGRPYGGWGGSILPHLDGVSQQIEYDVRYDFFDPKNRPASEIQIPVFNCPDSPANRFVEIQSQATTKSLNKDKDTVFQCFAATTDFISSNGVLMTRQGYAINALPGEQRIGNERQPMTDDENLPLSKITDGLSNTLLLIEQAGRPDLWRNRERRDGSGQFGLSPNARGAWAGWGSIAFGAANADTGERPGRGDATDCSVNCNNWFGIYGFHDGGANVLFCDGSVRFIGTSLDPLTFAYLTIRDDGHLVARGDY